MASESLVSLRRLRHAYREAEKEHIILDDLDLDIKQGECVALLGRSGSGKSTLLNLISGIDSPVSGEIEINGTNFTSLNEHERTLFRRRNIGFVYQFFNLIPTLTVEENVLLPLELNATLTQESHESAMALLNAVGLRGREKTYPDRLSGGEQQRVAITRALVHQPLLVLADEPTGNLDASTGKHILQLMDELVRQRGNTLILVTHSNTVAQTADRILLLEHGRISQDLDELNW